MKNKIITILLCLIFFSCKNEYKPKLEYPVVYIDTTESKHARWSSYVKVIVLKDRIGDKKYIYTQRGFHDRWADSIYKNCKIGDTIK